MMRNDYLNDVIRRGNELAVLDQAALLLPEKSSPARWIVATAFGVLCSLIPSVCFAQAFFQMI